MITGPTKPRRTRTAQRYEGTTRAEAEQIRAERESIAYVVTGCVVMLVFATIVIPFVRAAF